MSLQTTLLVAEPCTLVSNDVERQVLLRDGLLAQYGPACFLPPDLAKLADCRARSLRAAIGHTQRPVHLIAGTAAWVYLGGVLHVPLDLGIPHGAKPLPRREHYRVRSQGLAEADVWTLAGQRLTSPAATAVDVARFLPSDRARRLITLLAEHLGVVRDDAWTILKRDWHRPHSNRAFKLLVHLPDP